MHDSLRLSKMHRLPLSLKIAAEKVLRRGADMTEGLDVLAAAARTQEHSALLLPVFYDMLDTGVLPELCAPGFVEENINAARTHATCAAWGIDGVQRVTHVITAAALSDIWRRCLPWIKFLSEYTMALQVWLPWSLLRSNSATPSGELPALWLRMLTRLLDHSITLDSAVVGETRGFRIMFGEAWAHLVQMEPDDVASLQDLAMPLTLIMRSTDTDIIRDITEGAGGKRALATVIVTDLCNQWPAATPASSASLRRAASLFTLLRLALDNGLTEELQSEGIVAALTTICCSLSAATPADGMRAELLHDGLSLLVRVLNGPWQQVGVRIAQCIKAGLFVVLRTVARWLSPANTNLLIELFRETLPPLLPLRPVAAVLHEALLKVHDMDSALYIPSPELLRVWNRLKEQGISRTVVFSAYKDRSSETALVACSNLDCCNIWERHAMKRCGGCRHRLYCSRSCQRQDWRYGNHRLDCAKLAIPDSLDMLSHYADREFTIALLNHDYEVQRSAIAPLLLKGLLNLMSNNLNTELAIRWVYRYEDFYANNEGFLLASATILPLDRTPYAGFYGAPGSGTPMRRAFDAGRVMLHMLDLRVPYPVYSLDVRSYALPLRSATGKLFTGLHRLAVDIMAAGGSAADVESYASQIAALVKEDGLVAHSAVVVMQPVGPGDTIVHSQGFIE
ncbi:MYND-type domain-containing protein [Mycena indigotica]|uniref:MYND-type domain-containing protein n=1 Tax=Mycena indigotica TaxID=2126181 RepID=A0A8H6VT79_9AGAR|nr:MYND-type domain-containing protein [Mycena indigotica]KAF7293102.1 MYND-type domain-containing protein [Mycena indigotica]